jgi:hypothetical protein
MPRWTRDRLVEHLVEHTIEQMDDCHEVSLPDPGSPEEEELVVKVTAMFEALVAAQPRNPQR